MPARAVSDSIRPLLLGIECGGTHTVAIASHDGRHAEARLAAGPCNLRLVSESELKRHFAALARNLPAPASIGVGMAGVRDAADCRRVQLALHSVWRGVPCLVDHDLESALATAAPVDPKDHRTRVIILSGTGSCCYGRSDSGRTAKVGGWGHLLGDRGSAYDIAHRALRAAVEHLDHRGVWCRLGQQVLRRLTLNEPNDLIGWLQSAGKADVAGLAPEVFSAAAAGDGVARLVVQETTDLLADDAIACAHRLHASSTGVWFVLAGSVVLRQTGLAKALASRLRRAFPGCEVGPIPRESAWGAVVMADRALRSAKPGPVNGNRVTESVRNGKRSPAEMRTGKSALRFAPDALLIPASTAPSPTEQRNPRSGKLDRLPVQRAVELMVSEDQRLPAVIGGHAKAISRLVQLTVAALRRGGRLIYVGAGTSGRLGVLDAAECPPTFRTSPDLVQAVIAGGAPALQQAVEGAEDDVEAGARAMAGRGVRGADIVLGIAASGRTPFVWGALRAARSAGATTALLCFNPNLRISPAHKPDLVLALDTGPEVLTGSTRLKAGTATKLVLNILTTLTMVRLGKVRGNLMVDLNASNEKLRDRACRIAMELTGCNRAEAETALLSAGWIVAKAVDRLRRRRGAL